jgi:hypothetical protein
MPGLCKLNELGIVRHMYAELCTLCRVLLYRPCHSTGVGQQGAAFMDSGGFNRLKKNLQAKAPEHSEVIHIPDDGNHNVKLQC